MPAGVRYPTPPAPGEPIRATLLREIIDCLKRITPISGKNTNVDYGPYGTRVNGTPAGSSSPSAPGNPLFAIGTMDNPDAGESVDGGSPGETEPEKCKGIVNCYYMKGGVLFYVDDFKWDEENWKDGILAFSVSAGVSSYVPDDDESQVEEEESEEKDKAIRFFKKASELFKAQNDPDFYVYPLYKIDEHGKVELDFRSVINMQLFENIPIDEDQGTLRDDE